ncbi:MAG: Rrf2 family transcriptional regulator [Actinomycetota bacterium]
MSTRMFNQTTRYVLSVLCHLARHRDDRVPAHQIAADTGTPANYVAKILGVLRKRGVVMAEKGWGGGFVLHPRATGLSLGEVLAFFDERAEPAACPFVEPQCGCPLARSHERLGAVSGGVVAVTAGHIADPVVCPFGAPECVVAAPCPLHAHWGKVREGFQGLAATPLADLAGTMAR